MPINESDDPIIQLAKLLEPEYRRIREINEQLQERERQAYAKITEANTAIEGTGGYPDATFTLRLAFGVVKGYEEDGEADSACDQFCRCLQTPTATPRPKGFCLATSPSMDAKERIDLDTQLNFVCTADIIGGNSGSPVVNRQG